MTLKLISSAASVEAEAEAVAEAAVGRMSIYEMLFLQSGQFV